MGFRRDSTRQVPLAAAFPVLRAVQEAGDQAGGPGARHAPARGRVHPRAEGAELRLLRGADRTRLLAVSVHPGCAGGRDRTSRAGPRLPSGSRAYRSSGPAKNEVKSPTAAVTTKMARAVRDRIHCPTSIPRHRAREPTSRSVASKLSRIRRVAAPVTTNRISARAAVSFRAAEYSATQTNPVRATESTVSIGLPSTTGST